METNNSNNEQSPKKSWLERNLWMVAVFFAIFILRMCSSVSHGYSQNVESSIRENNVEQYLSFAKEEVNTSYRDTIEHSLDTKWVNFADRQYYTYIKTLKLGMKLYRSDTDNMLMEVYVLDGYIKIQSSTLLFADKTKQKIREMNAWIMSHKPKRVKGNIATTKMYYFDNFDITLTNQEDQAMHYMIVSSKN